MTTSLFIALIIGIIFSALNYFFALSEPKDLSSLGSLVALGSPILAAISAGFIATLMKPANNQQSTSSKVSEEDREQGIVKWFNVNKGFGFITQNNGDDIFVHYRSIRGHGRKKLIDGQAVSYTVINSNRGLQADDVDVIG
jgi:CspA family cold shock protein